MSAAAMIDQLESELADLHNAHAALGSECTDLKSEIADLKQDRRTMFGLLSTVQARCTELQDERDAALKRALACDNIDLFENVLQMLRMRATDPGTAENYVELNFSWDKAWAPGLPFRRVAAVFYRDGGKSPATLVSEANAARGAAQRELAEAWTLIDHLWEALEGAEAEIPSCPCGAHCQ